MTLPLPDIDTRNFDALVERARQEIPRYSREWTDHNVHDPGMTQIELGAWLVDQQGYSAGVASDALHASFAALLGVHPALARPAQGLLWPDEHALPQDLTAQGTDLAIGTECVARQQPGVEFSTRLAVHVSPARLLGASGEATVVSQAEPLMLRFDRPLVEGDSSRPISIGIELAGSEPDTLIGADGDALTRAAGRLLVEYRLSSPGTASFTSPWRRLTVTRDETRAWTRNGIVIVDVPAEPFTPDASAKRRAELRIRLRRRINPAPAIIRRLSINVLPMVQVQRVAEAVIGVGTGRPAQQFSIALAGMLADAPPILEVVEDGTFVAHDVVRNFDAAGPDDRVYVADLAAGTVTFGNGVNGRVPAAAAQVRHREYPLTQGAAGNLTVGLDWTVRGVALRGGVSRFGTIPRPVGGGLDAWGREQLRAEARRQAVSRAALVTDADLAGVQPRLAPLGVRRTSVVAGFDPATPCRARPGMRTLLITPARGRAVDDALIRGAVSRVVAPGRVIGERVRVALTRGVSGDVRAEVVIRDEEDAARVREAATRSLSGRLAASRREDDIEPWPPGRAVTRTELETRLAQIGGVVRVVSCLLGREGEAPAQTRIDIAPDAVAVLGSLELRARSAAPDGSGP